MSMFMEGFLRYSGLSIILCWLPIILIVRQAAIKEAIMRSIFIVAGTLAVTVGLSTLRLIKPEYAITGIAVCLLGTKLYRWGKEWQAHTLLFGKRLAFSPTLYPQTPHQRDAIILAVTLANAWCVQAWYEVLSDCSLSSMLPLIYRLWFAGGALAATLAWFTLGSWGSYQLGLYLENQLKFPNLLVGGLLRGVAAACLLTTLVLMIRNIGIL